MKISGILATLLLLSILSGCASQYPMISEISPQAVSAALENGQFAKYFDKNGTTLLDKADGLSPRLSSDWSRTPPEGGETTLDKFLKGIPTTAKKLKVENRETGTSADEAILLYSPPMSKDDYVYEFRTFIKNGEYAVTRQESGMASGGGGGCGGCFTPQTLVLMSDNTAKPIQDIQIGDKVKGFDFQTNQTTINKVVAVFKLRTSAYLIINGVEVTETHPFCTGRGEWKEAGMLKIGDIVIGENSAEIKIETIQKVRKDATVHNLTVDGTSNFFVSNGETYFLVHNKGGGGAGGG